MPVHLLKICVGIEDIDHLARAQKQRIRDTGRLVHVTRSMPRRAAEVLDGGSLYWIIRGFIQVRQRIIGLHRATNSRGLSCCEIERDPELVRTVPQPRRPHQGWRYLDPADAPADLADADRAGFEKLPPAMLAELRELGLV